MQRIADVHDIPDPDLAPPALDRHTPLAYTRFELVESAIFTKQVKGLLSDESYRELQLHVLMHPESGALIPGSGGFRKLRWRLAGRGKRGGARVIYMFRSAAGRVHLLYMYAKNDRTDLSARELHALRRLVSED